MERPCSVSWEESLLDYIERRSIIGQVYTALVEKGYEPKDQIMGYIITGDLALITNYKNARMLMAKVDRHDLLLDLLSAYLAEEPRSLSRG